MRVFMLLIATVFLLVESGGSRKPSPTAPATISQEEVSSTSTPNTRVDFDTEVKPILQSKCLPCHFNGGQMYERLPFDRGETVRKLGTKLFTRIKNEEERRILEQFLKQSSQPE